MKQFKLLFVCALVVALNVTVRTFLRVDDYEKPDVLERPPDQRVAFIPPNPRSIWRSLHSGMCSALPLKEGGYRVWVTGRIEGQPLSIGWVDLDRDYRVTAECSEPCIVAEKEDWVSRPAAGVFMPCVVDCVDHLRMYFAASGGPGLAFSHDGGKSWEKLPRRLLQLDAIDQVGIGTTCVVRDGPTWRLFYTTIQPGNRYFIRYAESADGIEWKKPANNLALDADPEGSCSRPNVWNDGLRWLMLYSRAPALALTGGVRQYRIHLAESLDAKTFREIGLVLGPTGRSGDFDSQTVEYGWSFPDDHTLFLYSGDDTGRTGFGVARLFIPANSRLVQR